MEENLPCTSADNDITLKAGTGTMCGRFLQFFFKIKKIIT